LPALLASVAPAQQKRITDAVENSSRVVLEGHVSPRLRSAMDQGPVDPSQALPYVTLVLQPSASQQAALLQLLASSRTLVAKLSSLADARTIRRPVRLKPG
jgi:hypothetical protein